MLRADNENFFNYFRRSQSIYDELFNKIKSKIMRQDTVKRSVIPAKEMLLADVYFEVINNNIYKINNYILLSFTITLNN